MKKTFKLKKTVVCPQCKKRFERELLWIRVDAEEIINCIAQGQFLLGELKKAMKK